MTKQDWVREIIAEAVVEAINRFKEEKPYTLHQIAIDGAERVVERLSEIGVFIKEHKSLI